MKKRTLSLILLIFGFFSHNLFAQVDFISPISGTWGNKQMLVIDNVLEGEYFYSVDGSDPEKFGFAYDGPVLLDITGNIDLKVTYVGPEGEKEFGAVKYKVVPYRGEGQEYSDFISKFYHSGFIKHTEKEGINIPSSLSFSFERRPKSYIPGKKLTVSKYSVLSRYVPCIIYDRSNNVRWRFIIDVENKNKGTMNFCDLPFVVDDWTTLVFKDNNFVYKVDDNQWLNAGEIVKIDRTSSHVISWKKDNNSEKSDENESIETYVLPSKPIVTFEQLKDGSGLFQVEGDSTYKLSIVSVEDVKLKPGVEQLYSDICIDTFYGEHLSGTITLGLYAGSLYQGNINVEYTIDKIPPLAPVITSDAKNFYSRQPVKINIVNPGYTDLYVAVSDPYYIEKMGTDYSENNEIFDKILASNFQLVSGDEYENNFIPEENKVIYYKVLAYTQKGNIKSDVVEFSVIVDQSSYYFNKDSKSKKVEGTLLNPFTDFDQCVAAFANSGSVSLRVKGDLFINKKYVINSNLVIINDGDGRIIFGPKGSIEMVNSTIDISSCRIHKVLSPSVLENIPFFIIKNGGLNIDNCQIAGSFYKNGTIIDSHDSDINVNNSTISVSAEAYSSFVSVENSNLVITNSFVSASADAAVIISASRSNIDVQSNRFSVMGNVGRIAELFSVKGKFQENEIRAVLSSTTGNISPMFIDKYTKIDFTGNKEVGF